MYLYMISHVLFLVGFLLLVIEFCPLVFMLNSSLDNHLSARHVILDVGYLGYSAEVTTGPIALVDKKDPV